MSNLKKIREADLYDTLVKTVKEFVVEDGDAESTMEILLHGIDHYTFDVQQWVISLGDLQMVRKIRPGFYPAMEEFYVEHGQSAANPGGVDFVAVPYTDYIPDTEISDVDKLLSTCMNSEEDASSVKAMIEAGVDEDSLLRLCAAFEAAGKATDALLPTVVGYLRKKKKEAVEEATEAPEKASEPEETEKAKPKKAPKKKAPKKKAPKKKAAPKKTKAFFTEGKEKTNVKSPTNDPKPPPPPPQKRTPAKKKTVVKKVVIKRRK
jgi:hypothetical protein